MGGMNDVVKRFPENGFSQGAMFNEDGTPKTGIELLQEAFPGAELEGEIGAVGAEVVDAIKLETHICPGSVPYESDELQRDS